MRRFILKRSRDISGISGIGVITEGIQFSSGQCVIAWVTKYKSIAIYESIEELMAIHGHDGKTELQWIDPVPVRVR